MEITEAEHTGSDSVLLRDLVDANRILVHQGVLDAFGHVSVRTDHDTFYLARNLAPALATANDIQRFTLEATTDDPRPAYLERFIHAEIYRARPDVSAVVHSHSPAVVPFAVSDCSLRPVIHMAGFLVLGCPVFEIREVAGEASDLLVRSPELGAALASTLGNSPVALMRGHGSVAVAATLKEAVYRAVYTEVNARIQAQAHQLGAVTYLSDGEGNAAARSNNSQIDRAWDYWRAQVSLTH